MKKPLITGFFLTLIILLVYAVIVFLLSPEEAFEFIREDGIVENTQIFCYLVSALIFIYLFVKSRSDSIKSYVITIRKWSYLLLGVFSLLILGEEISWGERIFDFRTPEKIHEAGGISLHNREYLFYLFGIPITAARIFFPLVLLYFAILPIFKAVSIQTRTLLEKTGLPTVSILIASLVLVNFIVWQIVYRFLHMPERWDGLPDYAFFQTAEEVYESNFAFLLLWSSITFYFGRKSRQMQYS